MIKVNEHTVVEVGKFYLVKHAVVISFYSENFIEYSPILGDVHRDPQFSIDWPHAHIDGRFAKTNSFFNVDTLGKTNSIIPFGKPNKSGVSYFKDTIYLKRKCVRLTTGILPPPEATKYYNWYKSMVGKSCEGKRCPHLGTKMFEENGELICPLHALRGDVLTEKIIPLECQR